VNIYQLHDDIGLTPTTVFPSDSSTNAQRAVLCKRGGTSKHKPSATISFSFGLMNNARHKNKQSSFIYNLSSCYRQTEHEIPHLPKAERVGSNAMTVINDITKLDNYEDEDIFDVVVKLEHSFGLKFEKDAFYSVKTFGDLCDVIANKVEGVDSDDCTTQQAFYKVRNAIAATQLIDKNSINIDTELQDIFPRDNRRQRIKQLQVELGLPLDILDIKSWLGWTIFIGIIASLIMFFIKWQLAVSGLLLFIAVGWTVNKFFAKEFEIKTVRQLTEKLSRENYVAVRRKKGTINKKEILKIITDTFSNDLDIDKAYLTRNDKFSWAT